ncbi:MAG: 23S rRNA (guanosine(2251)-2'-O)-methyltransferase RlmB [Deltaproteobacteria bacterium]|nr:23S rRNA (guanosine(2251)-2'-O)-methyltransferase RlmB [Deltaproteobacteria bacterium]
MSYEYVYGFQPILEILKAERREVFELYHSSRNFDAVSRSLIEKAKKRGLSLKEVSKEKLSELSAQALHQGLVLKTEAYPYVDEGFLIEQMRGRQNLFILILDQIQDPQNLGAILRTAHCAGVDAVFIPERRACEITPLVQKVSAGASEYLKISLAKNLARLIDFLKEFPVWVYGACAEAKAAYTDLDYSGSVAWVMGNEGEGLRSLVKQKCDALVSIPLRGRIDSLNVSVATGILLYEVLRQRVLKK